MTKRALDVLVSALALMSLWPVFGLIAVAVKWDSPGPVLFRQPRLGLGGRIFSIHKFRTMVTGAPSSGLSLTVGEDPRITRVGAWLRRTKLDELPQLWDVLRGEMSLVGPRPEVPEFLPWYPVELKERVLSVRPGMTDPVSLQFAQEAQLLAQSADPHRTYCEDILPVKLRAAAEYAESSTLWTDIGILWDTFSLLLRGATGNKR